MRFSPRNGEVILKMKLLKITIKLLAFQSPQWGSNSKDDLSMSLNYSIRFSPRNGEVILKVKLTSWEIVRELGFSPRNGEVILKYDI